MSITDELRDAIATATKTYEDSRNPYNDRETCHIPEEYLLAIADHIDAEHEAQVTDAFETRNSDENLEADGWIRLPVDADGVPIHAGDVLADGEYTFKVYELFARLFEKGSTHWSVINDEGCAWAACDVTHHHEPTVEDVLRELIALADFKWGSDLEDTIAEYAKRLQLKEDA